MNMLASKNGSLVSTGVKLKERYVKEFVIDFDLRVLQESARRLDFPYCESEPIKARDTIWVVRIFPNGSDKSSVGKVILELVGASEESTDVEAQYTLKNRNCGDWEDVIDTTNISMRQLKEVERKIVDSYRTALLINGTSGLVSEGSITLMLTLSFSGAPNSCQNISAVRNPPSILTNEVLRERLFHKATSDVDIVVEGTRIPAHKLILSLASPVFTAMFENQMQESVTNEIVISDFSEEVVRAMLRCVYDWDAVQSEVEKHADQLRFIANKYELSALECAATNHIIRTITIDNAVEVLLCAHKFDHTRIEEAAMDFIVKNIEHFSSLPDFATDLGFELISKLLRDMVTSKRVSLV